ncbi:MAG: hypothetical protein AAB870_03205 [Patescibacteria group bacterium]
MELVIGKKPVITRHDNKERELGRVQLFAISVMALEFIALLIYCGLSGNGVWGAITIVTYTLSMLLINEIFVAKKDILKLKKRIGNIEEKLG